MKPARERILRSTQYVHIKELGDSSRASVGPIRFQLSHLNRGDNKSKRSSKMAKIILVLALTVALASAQPIETIATSGGVSLSTQLLNWGEAAFQALLELAKHVLGNSRDETSKHFK